MAAPQTQPAFTAQAFADFWADPDARRRERRRVRARRGRLLARHRAARGRGLHARGCGSCSISCPTCGSRSATTPTTASPSSSAGCMRATGRHGAFEMGGVDRIKTRRGPDRGEPDLLRHGGASSSCRATRSRPDGASSRTSSAGGPHVVEPRDRLAGVERARVEQVARAVGGRARAARTAAARRAASREPPRSATGSRRAADSAPAAAPSTQRGHAAVARRASARTPRSRSPGAARRPADAEQLGQHGLARLHQPLLVGGRGAASSLITKRVPSTAAAAPGVERVARRRPRPRCRPPAAPGKRRADAPRAPRSSSSSAGSRRPARGRPPRRPGRSRRRRRRRGAARASSTEPHLVQPDGRSVRRRGRPRT